jgi:chaperone modulatory protein CbpM
MKKQLPDLARDLKLNETVIIHYVENEWVSPCETEPLAFDEEDSARIRLIRELQQAFGVNDEGIPLILHLLDQLHAIRYRVHFSKTL